MNLLILLIVGFIECSFSTAIFCKQQNYYHLHSIQIENRLIQYTDYYIINSLFMQDTTGYDIVN